jgi:hypothetical protein
MTSGRQSAGRLEREITMSSFVHTNYPARHPGIGRAISAFAAIRGLWTRFDSARGMATLLLAAMVSALLVVANQVIDTWTEGHLMAAWIALWVIGFAAIGLLAAPTRRASRGLRAGWQAWAVRRRQAMEDDKLWQVALGDARVMAELSRAMSADSSGDLRRYY